MISWRRRLRRIWLRDSSCQVDKLILKAYHLSMTTLPIGELKTRFSEVLQEVRKGEEVVISFGKKKEKIAVIIPYRVYKGKKRKLGLLEGGMKISKDFKITDEEFLNA